jgi:hypothetical protein
VRLLTKGFPRRNEAYWRQALQRLAKHPTPVDFPKYGYVLEANGDLVGVLLGIFTTKGVGDSSFTQCNLSGWYVESAFRSAAGLLTSQAFKYKDLTYLNISPAKHVQPIIEVQGFVRYSEGQFVACPVLSRGAAPAEVRVINGTKRPNVPFEPGERDLLLSHIGYGCIGVWCVTPRRAYAFIFTPRIAKRLIPCAQLIYCRSIDDFVRFARPLGWFLTLRGRPLVLLDSNGPIPGLIGRYFKDTNPKYYRGGHHPRLGDLTYTEAAIFGI